MFSLFTFHSLIIHFSIHLVVHLAVQHFLVFLIYGCGRWLWCWGEKEDGDTAHGLLDGVETV